ncbi:MAG: hypothetical protein AAGJ81_11815 [Verrucomicrobiota bacterium]
MRNRSELSLAIFLLVAGYSLVAGLLVQLVIAPRIDPGLLGSIGLIPGLDTASFHEMAVSMASAMKEEGWSAWEWNPGWSANQPVGVMAVFYYYLGASPLVLLPFNAFVHGASAVVLFHLIHQLGFSFRESIAGVLPFSFLPSTLTWVTQFHKDGIYCLGLFVLLLGCVTILKANRLGFYGVGLVGMVAGGILMATMRGYSTTLVVVAIGLASILVVLPSLIRCGKGQRSQVLGSFACLLLGSVLLIPFAGTKGGEVSQDRVVRVDSSEEGSAPNSTDQWTSQENENYIPPATPWITSDWLPSSVDSAFHRLIHNRTVFLWMFPDAGSIVDGERKFDSVGSVVAYAPRALLIGLFSPFPNSWLGEARSPTGGLQRRVAAIETLLGYLLLVGAGSGLILTRSRNLIFVLLVSLLLVVVLVYPVPAIGSLFRLRFGPFSLFLGVGLAFLFRYFWKCREMRSRVPR